METVLRGAGIFFVLLLILRLSGRRTMSETTPFDFVLLLIVAETTQQALLSDDYSLTNAAVLIVTLFTLDVALSLAKQRLPGIRRLLDGVPTVLVAHGHVDEAAMRLARIAPSDVLAAARQMHGLERMDQIRFVVLEANGRLSIIPRSPDEPA